MKLILQNGLPLLIFTGMQGFSMFTSYIGSVAAWLILIVMIVVLVIGIYKNRLNTLRTELKSAKDDASRYHSMYSEISTRLDSLSKQLSEHHSYGPWINKYECTQIRLCSVCGNEETKISEHDHYWKLDRYSDGYNYYTCTKCPETKKEYDYSSSGDDDDSSNSGSSGGNDDNWDYDEGRGSYGASLGGF
jgi:hypothetical protein